MADRRPVPGDVVIYCDPKGVDHKALCTVDWGRCINLVIVSADESKQDDYGRQIERYTSISDMDLNQVHGFYWRWPEDEKAGYKPPVSR